MNFHCFLCPKTIKTQFSPAGSPKSNGFGRWSASYEGTRDKGCNPETFRSLVPVVQNMGCFYKIWGTVRTITWTHSICHVAPKMPTLFPPPSWPHLQTDTQGPTFYLRFMAGKSRKAPEALPYPPAHSITPTVAHSCFPHSFCILFSIQKRWGSSQDWQKKYRCGCSGSRGSATVSIALSFPSMNPANKQADTNLDQYPGLLGMCAATSRENDPLSASGTKPILSF